MMGTPPRGKPNPGKVCPGAPASDSRSQDRDFSLQPDSTSLSRSKGQGHLLGPRSSQGRWAQVVPSHTPPAAQTPRRRLELGSLGTWQAQPRSVCGRLFQERTAWWRRSGVRIPLWTPLRWPLLQFPPASPPAPSRHPFSLLGC